MKLSICQSFDLKTTKNPTRQIILANICSIKLTILGLATHKLHICMLLGLYLFLTPLPLPYSAFGTSFRDPKDFSRYTPNTISHLTPHCYHLHFAQIALNCLPIMQLENIFQLSSYTIWSMVVCTCPLFPLPLNLHIHNQEFVLSRKTTTHNNFINLTNMSATSSI